MWFFFPKSMDPLNSRTPTQFLLDKIQISHAVTMWRQRLPMGRTSWALITRITLFNPHIHPLVVKENPQHFWPQMHGFYFPQVNQFSNSLDTNLMSWNLIQFWYKLSGVSIRPHRLRALFHEPALTSDTRSGPQDMSPSSAWLVSEVLTTSTPEK